MSLDADLLAAIDARIARETARTATTGTIASIIDNDNARVTFDGSNLAIPVKLAGDALFIPGDRVLLIKVGTSPANLWWVATAPLTRRWLSHNGNSLGQALGNTTSGSFADIPVPVVVPFTKRWDSTRVYVQITGQGYTLTSFAQVIWGAQFISASQPSLPTYGVTNIYINNPGEHISTTDHRFITGLAADDYTVGIQWQRVAGAGTVTCDTGDKAAISVMEISPT